MSRGRKPKPTTLKILHGNPGKRPLPEGEPQPQRALPDCPAHLDAEAVAEWERVAPELYDLGLLTLIDRAALAAYCVSWSKWIRAEREIEKLLAGEEVDSGDLKRREVVSNRALRNLHSFASEFGMTPAARTRIKVEPKEGDDPLAAFLKPMGG